MMDRLEGKRTIVTGAGSGIGRAIALRLASEGARVARADVGEEASRKGYRPVSTRNRGVSYDASTCNWGFRRQGDELER